MSGLRYAKATPSTYLIQYRNGVRVREGAGTALGRFGRVHRLDRRFLPNYLFAPDALVVVLGQDGLVANTLEFNSGMEAVIDLADRRGRLVL